MADQRPDSLEEHPSVQPFDEHNQELLSHVHPADWKNPEAAERYHLVVVGGGTAGLVSAAGAAGLGARVALVERHMMGGDCLNVGCVPSKGVISAARAWHAASRGGEPFGAPGAPVTQGNFKAAMKRMRRLRADISPVDSAARFRDLGIDVFLGEGRFVASDALEVDDKRLRFRRAVIATGGRAAAPPIPGLDIIDYLTNETIFSLTEQPKSLAVIGGGPIGCEMAQSFARFGTEVHVFDIADHLLPREDPDAAAIVQESMKSDGIILHLGVNIVEIKSGKGGDKVVVVENDGKRQEVACDQLLVAVGRKPNTEGLGLEAAGVEFGKRGVEVDDTLRTSTRRIFAAGDIASKYQFTHTADAMARRVLRNAFFFGRQRMSTLVIPWATYTSPEVAHVGLYQHEAEKLGHAVDTITIPMHEVDRAALDGETEGFLRVHLKKGTDKILGGTLVASHAGDMIGVLALAMTHNLGLSKLSTTIFPYPTQGEIFRKAGDAYMRGKLTPKARTFFDLWFRIFS
jgi:pyruvate/2-oxoglutarate dehydrogenase complex dihydrolipoamide dehydrogenase (E3) component